MIDPMSPYMINLTNETIMINFTDICKCTFNYAYNAPIALISGFVLILIAYLLIPILNKKLIEAKSEFNINVDNIAISISCFVLFFSSVANPAKPDYILFCFTAFMFGIFNAKGYMFGGIINPYLDKLSSKVKKKKA